MKIGRRELLTGLAATAAVGLAPILPASAAAETIDASFRFAVPRRMLSIAYAFCDPWRVDFADRKPDRIIHEASGVVFPTDRFDELDEHGHIVISAIRRDYAPPYPLTALRFDVGARVRRRLYELAAPAFNTAMEDGDIEDLAEICLAARVVVALCQRKAPPTNANGTVIARPTVTLFKHRYEEIMV